MTAWIRDGRRIVLDRPFVERLRSEYVRDAVRYADRLPTADERGLGMDRSDLQRLAAYSRREAERLVKVLACIDAGLEELPLELYPNQGQEV